MADVQAALEGVAATLSRAHVIQTQLIKPEDPREWAVTLASPQPRTAKLRVHITERLAILDVTLGESTPFEMRLSGTHVLDESVCQCLRDLASAVMEGRFCEELWFRGDQLVRSVGKVMAEQRDPVVVRWRHVSSLLPFMGLHHEVRRHGPYLPASRSVSE